jgi:hypothetical protein
MNFKSLKIYLKNIFSIYTLSLRPVKPGKHLSESNVRSALMSTLPAPVASIKSIILGFESLVV